MFTYKTNFYALSRRSSNITRSIFVRYSSSSSSSSSSTDKLENVVAKQKAAAKSTTKSGEQQQQQQQPFNLTENAKSSKIPFMPVINIPETEFAHNAFFSLHRPLLGLSDEDEKPFFNNKSEKQDQERLDDVLASYMMNLQPFVKPAAPGAELLDHPQAAATTTGAAELEDEQLERGVSFKIIENEEFIDDFMSNDLMAEQQQTEEDEEIEHIHTSSLPMYHMPESGDVVDYLTSIESNMKIEHAKLDAEDNAKALRLKKLEMIDSTKRFSQSKPRFYAINNNRNVHSRLRRYQQKWNLKD